MRRLTSYLRGTADQKHVNLDIPFCSTVHISFYPNKPGKSNLKIESKMNDTQYIEVHGKSRPGKSNLYCSILASLLNLRIGIFFQSYYFRELRTGFANEAKNACEKDHGIDIFSTNQDRIPITDFFSEV